MVSGEKNLTNLLTSMAPKLLPQDYVFCHFKNAVYGDYIELSPIASFTESEGLTLVLEKHVAINAKIKFESVFKAITLTVHSSLEAVGLTAAVATQLADNNISANVVAAYYHDHIFVPLEKADLAMSVLNSKITL